MFAIFNKRNIMDSMTEIAEIAPPQSKGARLIGRPGVRQFVKFCMVGLSSTVVDKGLLWFLQGAFPLFPWWVCATISFCFGVSNGFFWNRLWTFRAHGEGHSRARDQYFKFLVSNSVGLALNLGFTKLFLVFFTGQVIHTANPDRLQVLIASLCAAPIVVIWNFTIAKFWTFRKS